MTVGGSVLEPRSVKWRRRAATIPTMLAGTFVALFGLPLIAPALVVADLARARRRLPMLRVYLFTLQYMINDSVEILLSPAYWAVAGFGTRIGTEASIARHERLQLWSLELLEKRADQLLGVELDMDVDAIRSMLLPGPVVVVSRHVSLFDASLPGLACQRAGLTARGVIMAELLADPGFDLIYGRLGSVFIPRDGGPKAVAAVDGMTRTTARAAETAYIIFPEGRLFRPAVRDRSLERLTDRDPDRASRIGGLNHLLPPRPGGMRTLLDAVPEADVVLLDHRGLDRFPGLKDLAAAVPLNDSITLTANRIPREEIPADPEQFEAWLDDLWLDLDRRLADSLD